MVVNHSSIVFEGDNKFSLLTLTHCFLTMGIFIWGIFPPFYGNSQGKNDEDPS